MEDYLYHWGVLGMKWGHRKDPKRYSEDASKVSDLLKKNTKELSNDELALLVDRLYLEQKFSSLNKSKLQKVRDFIFEDTKAMQRSYLTSMSSYFGKSTGQVLTKLLSEMKR